MKKEVRKSKKKKEQTEKLWRSKEKGRYEGWRTKMKKEYNRVDIQVNQHMILLYSEEFGASISSYSLIDV